MNEIEYTQKLHMRQQKHVCVAGNHDWAAVGKIDIAEFNPDAATTCRWTAQQLSPEDVEYLENRPLVIQKEGFTLVHGSPREPMWEYLISLSIAKQNFAYFQSQFCLVGHSHVPLVFRVSETDVCSSSQFLTNIGLALGENRLIINPGSIGQPRDGDTRASYAVYDSDTRLVRLYRVPYDIGAIQARMVKYNLPMRLVARLSYGV